MGASVAGELIEVFSASYFIIPLIEGNRFLGICLLGFMFSERGGRRSGEVYRVSVKRVTKTGTFHRFLTIVL
jgi:hypothetical protein